MARPRSSFHDEIVEQKSANELRFSELGQDDASSFILLWSKAFSNAAFQGSLRFHPIAFITCARWPAVSGVTAEIAFAATAGSTASVMAVARASSFCRSELRRW